MVFGTTGSIWKQREFLDLPDVVERAATDRVLAAALAMERPPNWHGVGIPAEEILAVSTDSGITTCWVPPLEVIRALVAAEPSDRSTVLMGYESTIVADCRRVLGECTDGDLVESRVLLDEVVAAYDAGHYRAALTLAVVVGEPLAKWASLPRGIAFENEDVKEDWEDRRGTYDDAALELAGDGPLLGEHNVCRRAVIAPIPKFFGEWWPERPAVEERAARPATSERKGRKKRKAQPARPAVPVPESVSRHVVVHHPHLDHMRPDNALRAVMLCVAILRDQQDWCDEVAGMG